MDSYGEQPRVRNQIVSASPLNWPAECTKLVSLRVQSFFCHTIFHSANVIKRWKLSDFTPRIKDGLYVVLLC